MEENANKFAYEIRFAKLCLGMILTKHPVSEGPYPQNRTLKSFHPQTGLFPSLSLFLLVKLSAY